MFNYDPVEGVHYIFDRYTFLNTIMEDGGHDARLTPESTESDITQAIRLARAMYHPDRQSRSGEAMKKQAERMSHLIGNCEKFLVNSEIKSLYDEKLATFQKNKPNMVSTNGHAIIDLTAQFIDIESLLSDDVIDTTDLEARIKSLCGYNETEAPQVKTLFDTMPDNQQIKSLYRASLTKKLTYITLLEDVAWAKVGIINRKDKIDGHLTNSDEYAEKVELALKNTARTHIDTSLEQRSDSARIGLSQLPLLLSFNPAAKSTVLNPTQMQEILQKMKDRAHQNFEIRAEYVRDIARQKQAVLDELVKLTPVTQLNDHDKDSPIYDFYLINPDQNEAILRLQLDARTGNAAISEFYHTPLPMQNITQFETNSFAVERNPEILDILIEVSAAADRTFNAVRKRFIEKTPTPVPKIP